MDGRETVLSFYEALISEIEIIKFVYSWRFKKFKIEMYNFLDTECRVIERRCNFERRELKKENLFIERSYALL